MIRESSDGASVDWEQPAAAAVVRKREALGTARAWPRGVTCQSLVTLRRFSV